MRVAEFAGISLSLFGDSFSSNMWRSLSIDHDFSLERKLSPSSRSPSEGTTDAITLRISTVPTRRDRMRKRFELSSEPSASR